MSAGRGPARLVLAASVYRDQYAEGFKDFARGPLNDDASGNNSPIP
jgi:hypothetical protein